MTSIRPAAVAGTFYPAEGPQLETEVRACLAEAGPAAGQCPKLLIVPHAGYVYSGAIAGKAYALLKPWAARIRRVVLLGPTHRVAIRGLAVPTVDCFETPLGRVEIDRAARDALSQLPQVQRHDAAHAQEHSLEVQLPFLQCVLGDSFKLLPLAVGDAGTDEVAEVVEKLWGGDETLIVVSSDLSHFLPYQHACATDRMTASRIVGLATDLDPYEACGALALNGALVAARRHGLRAQLLGSCNSGDTAGDRRRVVGYAALALSPTPTLDTSDGDAKAGARAQEIRPAGDDQALGAALLSRARNSIAAKLGLALEPEPPHPALQRPGATFVTLRDAAGELRGCIGRLEAARPLEEDVRSNAAAAAFDDPRFGALKASEWPGLQIEVSVLDPAEPLPAAATRAEALGHLHPHEDGVIIEWNGRRATFLPQVWQQLPDPEDFISALLRKAGLPGDFWHGDVKLYRYRVRHYECTAPLEAA